MVLTGHCLCKAVTYSVDVDKPLLTGYDHCDDCQRQSGSTYCKIALHFTMSGDMEIADVDSLIHSSGRRRSQG